MVWDGFNASANSIYQNQQLAPTDIGRNCMLLFNPLLHFDASTPDTFENIVGKREIARNEILNSHLQSFSI